MLSGLVGYFEEGSALLVQPNVMRVIRQYTQFGVRAEAGGILLGRYRRQHIEVTGLTEPGATDVRKRFQFIRCDKSHELIAECAWKCSGGEMTYIGEWHTHPETAASPSAIDTEQWKSNLPSRPMILIIHGIEQDWIGIKSSGRNIQPITNLNSVYNEA